MMKTSRRVLLGCAAMALAAASCGGGSATEKAADQELAEYGDSALVGLLELDDSEARFNQEASLSNELATACLRERGFDVPQLVSEPIRLEPMAVAFQELGEEAFTLEHGFGILDGAATSSNTSNLSPLDVYIQTLGATEADSLYKALYGDPVSGDPSTSCRWIASEQAGEQLGEQRWDLFNEFSNEVNARIDADSRVVALYQNFATCMAELGYNYASPYEPRSAATERFGEFMSAGGVGGLGEEDFWAGLSDESRTEFEQLRQQEIDEAIDTINCERAGRTELIALSSEIEQAWIRENNDRIHALLNE